MTSIRLPFSSLKKAREFETIETPDGRVIHLLRRYCTTANENPNDVQQLRANQRIIQEMLEKATANYAAEHGLSESAAREELLGAQIKSAEVDGEGNTEIADKKSFVDYLEPEDRKVFLQMNEEMLPVPTGVNGAEDPSILMVKAATMMIRERSVFGVRVLENTSAGAEVLKVESIRFPVEMGTRFEFGETVVTVTSYCEEGNDNVPTEMPIEPLKRPLAAGKFGLLKNFETGAVEIGLPDWTEQNTIDFIPGVTIRLLYDFYCAEALKMKLSDYQALQASQALQAQAALPDADSKKEQPRKGKGSSTGAKSITESNPTAGETNGSTPLTLEPAQSI